MQESWVQFKKVVGSIHPLSDEDWNAFAKIWHPFTAARREIISREGEQEKYLYFVTDGVQRIYSIDDQDREATILFTYAPSFGGVLDAFLLQQPSRYHYEALTPSAFLRASFTDVQDVISQRANIGVMIRQGVAAALAGVLERLVELQCYSSEEKFKKLLQRSPHILQLVPQKYLANYLGIDPTNFSKLMNKVRI